MRIAVVRVTLVKLSIYLTRKLICRKLIGDAKILHLFSFDQGKKHEKRNTTKQRRKCKRGGGQYLRVDAFCSFDLGFESRWEDRDQNLGVSLLSAVGLFRNRN